MVDVGGVVSGLGREFSVVEDRLNVTSWESEFAGWGLLNGWRRETWKTRWVREVDGKRSLFATMPI